MINLEQVRLLEARVAKAVEYIERLSKENAALRQRETELQAKLETNQIRIDELELLVMDFKVDQGEIEEGILSALDRLSKFEKAMEKSLKEKPAAAKAAVKAPKSAAEIVPEHTVPAESADTSDDDGQTCFEIPEAADDDDIPDPLGDAANDASAADVGELEIF